METYIYIGAAGVIIGVVLAFAFQRIRGHYFNKGIEFAQQNLLQQVPVPEADLVGPQMLQTTDIVFDKEVVAWIAKGQLSMLWDELLKDVDRAIESKLPEIPPGLSTIAVRAIQLGPDDTGKYQLEVLRTIPQEGIES